MTITPRIALVNGDERNMTKLQRVYSIGDRRWDGDSMSPDWDSYRHWLKTPFFTKMQANNDGFYRVMYDIEGPARSAAMRGNNASAIQQFLMCMEIMHEEIMPAMNHRMLDGHYAVPMRMNKLSKSAKDELETPTGIITKRCRVLYPNGKISSKDKRRDIKRETRWWCDQRTGEQKIYIVVADWYRETGGDDDPFNLITVKAFDKYIKSIDPRVDGYVLYMGMGPDKGTRKERTQAEYEDIQNVLLEACE